MSKPLFSDLSGRFGTYYDVKDRVKDMTGALCFKTSKRISKSILGVTACKCKDANTGMIRFLFLAW